MNNPEKKRVVAVFRPDEAWVLGWGSYAGDVICKTCRTYSPLDNFNRWEPTEPEDFTKELIRYLPHPVALHVDITELSGTNYSTYLFTTGCLGKTPRETIERVFIHEPAELWEDDGSYLVDTSYGVVWVPDYAYARRIFVADRIDTILGE